MSGMMDYNRYEQPMNRGGANPGAPGNQSRNTTTAKPRRDQQVLVWCDPERTVLELLMGRLQEIAAGYGKMSHVLLYGVTPKQRQGFIFLFFEGGMPQAVRDDLARDTQVLDYLVYDLPTNEETQRDLEDDSYEPIHYPSYEPEIDPLRPPQAPNGYTLLSIPRPLYSSQDSYWVAWVWSGKAEGLGLLLYGGDGQKVAFLLMEEATTLLYTLLERAVSSELVSYCAKDYLTWHAPGISLINLVMHSFQLAIFQHAAEHDPAQEQEEEGQVNDEV